MPDPFNKAKMTGDTHPPELESDLPLEEASADAVGIDGMPSDRGRAAEPGRKSKPSRGVKKAGLLNDGDAADGPGQASPGESGRGTDRQRG